MADVRVVGTPDEIDQIVRALGMPPVRLSKRRDGGVAGYFSVETPKVVCLDCETTGLSPYEDEILTLSIVDWSGKTLLDGRYKPTLKKEWPDASRVNGIYPKDVRNCPSIFEEQEHIREVIAEADEIVAYNAQFDLGFLKKNDMLVRSDQKVTDTMLEFARERGIWDEWHESFKWHKLTAAASYIGYEWTGKAHGSLADALACLAVQKWCDGQKRKGSN